MITTLQSILGIPIHNLNMRTAVQEILRLHHDYQTDLRPRYVATVNVDFLTNTWGWVSGNVRHPELLDILRGADLVTADGMPLVWLSKLMGTPLQERVTGADLILHLAEVAAERRLSLFLFGAQEELAMEAADSLRKSHPNLEIAGILSPYVQTDGKSIIDAEECDEQVINQINASGADILLISLGNPKQELWFRRVQNRLTIPVSIGVGGSLSFVVGKVKRAPIWAQELGLEWLFRLVQEPRRLWRRYFRGGAKFLSLTLPLVVAHGVQRVLFSRETQASLHMEQCEDGSLEVSLPSSLSRVEMEALRGCVQGGDTYRAVSFDFSSVQSMDPLGLGILQELARWATRNSIPLYAKGLNTWQSLLLRVHQLVDFFDTAEGSELTHGQEEKQELGPALYVDPCDEYNLLRVCGDLRGQLISRERYLSLMARLDGRPCLMDLSGCGFADSGGLSFLLKIRRRLIVNNQSVVAFACSQNVEKALRVTRLMDCIALADDISSARSLLAEGRVLISPLQKA